VCLDVEVGVGVGEDVGEDDEHDCCNSGGDDSD
jgi:hypothetical protein